MIRAAWASKAGSSALGLTDNRSSRHVHVISFDDSCIDSWMSEISPSRLSTSTLLVTHLHLTDLYTGGQYKPDKADGPLVLDWECRRTSKHVQGS